MIPGVVARFRCLACGSDDLTLGLGAVSSSGRRAVMPCSCRSCSGSMVLEVNLTLITDHAHRSTEPSHYRPGKVAV